MKELFRGILSAQEGFPHKRGILNSQSLKFPLVIEIPYYLDRFHIIRKFFFEIPSILERITLFLREFKSEQKDSPQK